MHAHDHKGAGDRRALAVALGLILAFMVVEVTAGVVASSVALIADAGHMLTDVFALAAAIVAARLALRPASGPWTFGLGRAEILAFEVLAEPESAGDLDVGTRAAGGDGRSPAVRVAALSGARLPLVGSRLQRYAPLRRRVKG